jgi:hypothetical protein
VKKAAISEIGEKHNVKAGQRLAAARKWRKKTASEKYRVKA